MTSDQPCFTSFDQLDEWAQTTPRPYSAVLSYHPRSNSTPSQHGKLLVCHDYKGGYTEKPDTMSYTFNFWSACDTFVYFSHHRVTIPPAGWITASHRQGVKMLGTLIFEGGAEPDCLRLLVGKLPSKPSGPAISPPASASLPISPYYARILANLAAQRGFDGYLLNFECPLQGGPEQARAVAEWIAVFRREMKKVVGDHAEVIWYDSVIVNGQLRWQDRLNSINLPFFLPSTGFFGNYTWPSTYPAMTAQYFLSLAPSHLGSKTLRDLYIGIDVWGRGSHGGGGFGCYKALSHISPSSLGLSVALFGQAWTWESEQDKPGWDWHQWWNYERKLWCGVKDATETVDVPEVPRREGEPECTHGPFTAVSSFFERKAPPDPSYLAFHSTFSPGVGQSWFVDGVKLDLGPPTKSGWWTDISKQTSMGDLLWPSPSLSWEGDLLGKLRLPTASSDVCMSDAWNGGSSVSLTLSAPGSDNDDAAFRSVWLPIQSLVVTAGKLYTADIVYKIQTAEELDLDVAVALKSSTGKAVEVTPASVPSTDFEEGWTRLSVNFSTRKATGVQLGLILSIIAYDVSQPLAATILLGQMNVYPKTETRDVPIVLWASSTFTTNTLDLEWETATTRPQLTSLNISSPEDPNPVFPICTPDGEVEEFMYFHVYGKRYDESGTFVGGPENSVWIGLTGWEGVSRRWAGDLKRVRSVLGFAEQEQGKARIFVRGVKDRGRLSKWEEGAYVDVEL
ncbi:glycosyl hydrolase family 85-domain-containing protein [Flagelloscypha sp. PMI_526]|nr:glycosyl hydrolase family 85-domain-containing protein [Flagelloscypha sp. PMI_526]